MYKCEEKKERNSRLIEELVRVWESSVRATHSFLTESETEEIKRYVPQALREAESKCSSFPPKAEGKG